MPPNPDFAVSIVSHDSADDLPACLAAVAMLSPPPAEVLVVDSGSTDRSLELAAEALGGLAGGRLLELGTNAGFAAAMNAAIEASRAPWILSLNPDARPRPDYVTRLFERSARHPQLAIGALTGRLLRFDEPGRGPTIDACGMRLTPTWRHLDRGSGEPDDGRYRRPERVFGATGAASLFSRAALADAAVEGDTFAPELHTFREDAELCFRLRERGWEVLYEPTAVARHRRHNLPQRRRAMSASINFHSLKNRYLLRAYHQTPANLLATLVPAGLRDLAAFLYVLLFERRSLAAYAWLWRHRHEIARRARLIRGRRRRSIDAWFWHPGRPL